jgi:hypothetical protein
MMGSQASAAASANSLNAASYSAGANNGAWMDVTKWCGEGLVSLNIGAVTGSVVFKVQDATDISGTGAADIANVVTGTLSTPNTAAKLVFNVDQCRGFVRVVATVTTGPVLAAGNLHGHPGTA